MTERKVAIATAIYSELVLLADPIQEQDSVFKGYAVEALRLADYLIDAIAEEDNG